MARWCRDHTFYWSCISLRVHILVIDVIRGKNRVALAKCSFNSRYDHRNWTPWNIWCTREGANLPLHTGIPINLICHPVGDPDSVAVREGLITRDRRKWSTPFNAIMLTAKGAEDFVSFVNVALGNVKWLISERNLATVLVKLNRCLRVWQKSTAVEKKCFAWHFCLHLLYICTSLTGAKTRMRWLRVTIAWQCMQQNNFKKVEENVGIGSI